MNIRSEFLRVLTKELQSHGVRRWEVTTTGGHHRRLSFNFDNRHISVILPSTPSDDRAAKNMVSIIRRLMGVRGVRTLRFRSNS